MRQREAPSYSSSRVQRATRINSIEAARLEQTLQYLEKAKLHQCRLSNQDIRLISLSLDYIQMSSGHSPEAWRPPQPSRQALAVVVSDDEDDPGRPPFNTQDTTPEDTADHKSPFFLYGERIWERKRRRIQRPVSAAVPSRRAAMMDGTTLSSITSEAGSSTRSQRPKSSPGKQQALQLAVEAGGFYRYPSRESSSPDDLDPGDQDYTFITQQEGGRAEFGSRGDFEDPSIVLSTGLSRASTPRGRVTPHQAWEDDTSLVTKRILKSQTHAHKGRQLQAMYLAPDDVMTSAAARNVRGLARQIRVSATATVPDRGEILYPHGVTPLAAKLDVPPKRPAHHAENGFNRRASVGEIINQRRPTLTSGAWKSHLGQTSDTPMSLAARRQKVLESKKEMNETRNQVITGKVKDFVATSNSRQMTSKTFCI
ncbi:hypothetical protein ElyMa_000620100 [Elysia marginata]|uniref:Uncharacterized protein n=1 Tax=Elysia marginata TaxID=1093978 RepID=A0AAV4G9D9_9GAST|nr:hypothetical protein ElyMa_000620100 [Elysia marginata]